MQLTSHRVDSDQTTNNASPHEPLAPEPPTSSHTSAESPHTEDSSKDSTHVDPQEYLPRNLLSQGPAPLTAVLLTYPDDAPPGVFRSTLMLFIDEHGDVRRIRVTGSPLPRRLEEVVRQAFSTTRFAPGLQQDQAVKSRIEIEVEFAQDIPPAGHSAL